MYHENVVSSRDLSAELLSSEVTAVSAGMPTFISPQHELQAGFELPTGVWRGMLGCYAVFFLAITLATGGSGRAVFAIVVSALYAVMYFGTAKVLADIAGPEAGSPLLRKGGILQTWTGPMDRRAVFSQVLIVPVCVAIFGISIAAVCAVVLP